ncbi:M3 family metallopeptidase [Sphingomonas sp. HDW15A]|uniref:M3 family metallopeptidase n=1 Tax=Sphingomonas sp. HDW15A TaxID=2714942 RepID=UPI001409E355|nr:M3 family metallopeptidase [Sphingomonas sp. HDW15A]QIK96365.1 M3 family metallopeptidase [Sphingomonas sp. HDW15A]
MKTILMASAAALVMTGGATAAMAQSAPTTAAASNNILLADWKGPYQGVPPWDHSKPELYDQAIQVAIDELKREAAVIANNPQAPTFANTIEASDKTGERISNVLSMFSVMTDNMSNPAYEALDKKWSPLLSAAFDEISLDPKYFARVETLYNKRDSLGLDAKQMRLLTRTYDGLVRRGVKLDAAKKEQLKAMNKELSSLFSEFNSRLLKDEGTWIVATEAEMAGIPNDVKQAAASLAKDKNLGAGKYAIRNTRSAADPVLSFATNRALRQKVWQAFVNRGDNGNANDTNAIIAKIVKLRADRAHLLGFKSHAELRMQDTMAKTPERAMDLMMRVWPAAVKRVGEEVAEMKPIAAKDGVTSIEPWDYRFYMEKVRKAKYDLSQDEIKPYFQLDNLVKGMHWSAEQLYDLKFTENTGKVPVWEPSVRTFEVTNAKTGKVIGLWYLDTYAREGKRSGAWATGYRDSSGLLGSRPKLVSNNNNFIKPGPGEPVLITLDDATTLFHEFGHAIHGLLTDVYYPSLSGSQRDFVEYPSQVNENWLLTRPVLERFARHYKTGEPMPESLLKKIEASDTFNQGYETVQYLSSALVDMKLHTKADGVVDPDAFEKKALAEIGMPKETVMRHRLPQFGHLFSSDAYSAGYYSYLWSETMDADTWAAFEEAGNPFDRTIADRFRTVLLSTGNETDRAEAYRQFRGRDPDVKALLKRRGFPTN